MKLIYRDAKARLRARIQAVTTGSLGCNDSEIENEQMFDFVRLWPLREFIPLFLISFGYSHFDCTRICSPSDACASRSQVYDDRAFPGSSIINSQ